MDTRRDEGQFYPYGKRVMPTAPTDGDVRHAEFEGIEELPAKFTDEDVRRKMNTLIGTLKGTTAALAVAFALPLLGAGVTVETARKGEIYNDEPVVVGVAFDASGLATTADVARVEQALGGKADAASVYTKAETDARIVELAPEPSDYAAVRGAALSAVQPSRMVNNKPLSSDVMLTSDDIDWVYEGGGMSLSLALGSMDAEISALYGDVSTLKALTAPKRYALFIVDVNCETSGAFTGFELKGTTNNFSHAVTEDVRLQFYSQSEIADTGREGHIDRMMLFVCTSHDSEDVRSWTRIPNTIDFPHQLTRIAALVDVTCLERHPDGEWLRDDNEELIWCYLRDRPLDPPYEYEKGTTKSLWRPIVPVRWYRELPAWARGES